MQVEHIEEYPEFTARDKRSVWIFKLEADFSRATDFSGMPFCGKWLRIDADGAIRIPKGYAWNGSSPKYSIFDLVVFGTPDGIVNIDTMKPMMYYPTLVHDALYQYFAWHGLTRKQVDDLFLVMMREVEFKLAWLYYAVVRLLGGLFVPEKHAEIGEVGYAV